jgi:transglutaminase-like putative cysteine protease
MASLAEELLGELTRPAEIASQLTRAVAQRIAPAELDSRFAGVLETARNRAGDCVDRAVLLTTLLRNRGIAARVRSGIWLDTSTTVFRYHMWTEAWIDNQWQSLDPTLGGPVGLGHIAMVHEPLGDGNPYEAVVPVLEAMQDIERIEVVSERRPRE